MKRNHLLLGALGATLAATLGLALQAEPEPAVAVLAPASRPKAATVVEPAPPAPAPLQERSAWPSPGAAALAAWSAPPPPAPAAPAAQVTAPRPPPPAFPYQWIGQLVDGAEVQALLSGSQRSFGARVGDVLDGRWRIERIVDGRIEATWLATGELVALNTP